MSTCLFDALVLVHVSYLVYNCLLLLRVRVCGLGSRACSDYCSCPFFLRVTFFVFMLSNIRCIRTSRTFFSNPRKSTSGAADRRARTYLSGIHQNYIFNVLILSITAASMAVKVKANTAVSQMILFLYTLRWSFKDLILLHRLGSLYQKARTTQSPTLIALSDKYIGSTFGTLSLRMARHGRDYTKFVSADKGKKYSAWSTYCWNKYGNL